MSEAARAGRFGLGDEAARAFGHALRQAGYANGAGALTGAGDRSTLARLFALGAAVSRESAVAALAGVGLQALEHAQVVVASAEGRIVSRMRVTTHEDLVFLHDRTDLHGPSDQVAAVGPASRTLAGLTVRSPAGLALDLGTGCGIQALLAARHARRVIATDVSERALDIARVNAAMNGIENVELRQGDLFEPVRGERFDLIVANPPFVISPESSHVFRDSGLIGDEVSRTVVAEAAAHLTEGGRATILCEWIRRAGEDWRDVPRRWVAERGCDALALHYRTSEPEVYAGDWNAALRERDPDAYVQTIERWTAYQRSLGAVGVSTGALVLHRPPPRRAPWFRAEEMPAGPSGAASEHLLRLIAGQELMPATDDVLLACRLELAPGLALRQLVAHAAAGWQAGDAELRVEPGIGVSATVPAAVVHVLLSLDAQRPLSDVVDQAAGELGVDEQTLREQALAMARRLLELGFAARAAAEAS